ncbi:haloacid dehalogenase-like hydrolase [Klebsiella pneumoniae]|uniref:Haloacid dehalogenase-like hydrolase n=1 Tax=Klebsiella pneumoniae TaxID=573 RepID=A0A447RTW2_KLEPN|nr:haloacid dehalogenase-like hydrolase [Klebsiella pneumoniae]
MHKLRAQGHRVVVLSKYQSSATPRSGPMNTRKCARPPIAFICRRRWDCVSLKRKFICEYWKKRGFSAADTVFFDDNVDNIAGANRLGITSILVTGKETIPDYFAKQLC